MLKAPAFACLLMALSALPVSSAHADITLALTGPFTGLMAAQGEEIKAGAGAAADEINAAGGVLGEKLVLDYQDDTCTATQATIVANKIIANPPVGVIGPLCSAATLAVEPIYAEAGLPQVTFSSNPAITEKGYKNLFRLVGRDDKQAPDLAAHLIKNYPKGTKIAVVDDKGSWGLVFADLTTATLTKSGYGISLRDSISPGQKDFSALITRLKTEGITAVVMGLYVTEAALLVRQAREQGFKGDFFGGDPLQTPEFAKVAGPAADGVRQSGLFDPRGTPGGDRLFDKLKSENKTVGVYTFYAYSAVKLYADALARAKSRKPADVVTALATSGTDTILGPVSFDAKGDLKNFTYGMFVWKNGDVVPVR